MATYDNAWYVNSVGYAAVTAWATGATIAAGALRRQLATPTVGNERVFVCIVAGTTHATTEPTWTVSRGAKTTDNTVTWQECTGASAVNGDLTSTPSWSQAKAFGTSPDIGVIIKRNNGASYQICSTTGFALFGGSEPAFSDTAGVTTNDNGNTWTSLGPVGNFTAGGAPHARLGNVFGFTWFLAGNTVYVGDNHAESQTASINISFVGSVSTVGKILCHNHLSSYPPAGGDLTTGATIATTGANNVTITGPSSGIVYTYGLAFRAGVGQTSGTININASNAVLTHDNCSFEIANTGGTTNSYMNLGSGTVGCNTFNNTKVKFANVSQQMAVNSGQFFWQNTGQILASGSLVPNALLALGSNAFLSVLLEALDLSQLTGALFSGGAGNLLFGGFLIKDCKLNASMTIASPPGANLAVQLVRSDSGATGYKSARYAYEGTETTETSITRTGGATDPTGQAQSRKIVTTANSQWLRPFKVENYALWNATTGANVTVTAYGVINAAALPNNDDVWIEVEYLGSSSFPTGTIVNTTKSNVLAANAAVSADTSAWDNTATARANSHAYVLGDAIKLASNPGRIFFCTTAGTSAGSEPGGYASAVDGGSVTDSGAVFRAGCRFSLATTLSAPQPGMAGLIYVRASVAKPSSTFYIDPQFTLT